VRRLQLDKNLAHCDVLPRGFVMDVVSVQVMVEGGNLSAAIGVMIEI